MNNQIIGHQFELELVAILSRMGYWVHFITPNAAGQQPFDIIAVKNGEAYAIDCKTSVRDVIPLTRLEDNQVYAFELWKARGNGDPIVAVKYDNKVYFVSYTALSIHKKIALTDDMVFAEIPEIKKN